MKEIIEASKSVMTHLTEAKDDSLTPETIEVIKKQNGVIKATRVMVQGTDINGLQPVLDAIMKQRGDFPVELEAKIGKTTIKLKGKPSTIASGLEFKGFKINP